MAQSIEEELAELRARSLLRKLREIDSPQQPAMEFAGKKLINFSSNDYLGLATEPCIREAAKIAIDQYGVGAGASRLISGTFTPHVRLEEKLAEFKRTEAALAFSSGYTAALGTLGALLRKEDVVILDKLSHASLLDGARLSGAVVRVFPHNHLGKLESHLQWARENHPEARIVVVTESVFSMDGDWAPLLEIIEIKNRYGALLLLDEAHAIGVIGSQWPRARGASRVAGHVDIQLGTLSKALGVARRLCLRQTASHRTHYQSRAQLSSIPLHRPRRPSRLPAPRIDFLLSNAGENRRQHLRANLAHFADEDAASFRRRKKASQCNHSTRHCGGAEAALEASQYLLEKGFFVPAIRYPTVARDAATSSGNHFRAAYPSTNQRALRGSSRAPRESGSKFQCRAPARGKLKSGKRPRFRNGFFKAENFERCAHEIGVHQCVHRADLALSLGGEGRAIAKALVHQGCDEMVLVGISVQRQAAFLGAFNDRGEINMRGKIAVARGGEQICLAVMLPIGGQCAVWARWK